MPAGRPLKFPSVEELDKQISEYFAQCAENKRPPTITGLAVYLDTSRETLREYKEREEFVDSIKRALAFCENFIDEGMLTNKLNTTAAIFNLKNNYGWKDKTETEFSGGLKQYVISEGETEPIPAPSETTGNTEGQASV